ncbi:hypothetical protein J31TS4_23150 [Paenibacillus sp. J31TS4]|uniref:recombinase family protein n=1 Tax=Paenibacillus sp. J31TS4 TaxID=2807195 RepID=UPI001B264F4F|nr:recombinase family protein [Paenibacillus sp. J31TS4]GIP39035.1 hypothetical protein J31TS4_23150 [Paenibacillus sp. J31TS4]
MGKQHKAAIYIRANTGCALKKQEEQIQRFIASKELSVFDVYSDSGYSGNDFKRPEIRRLFADMKEGKFQYIVVWRLDRLSRSCRDILTLIDNELEPRKIKLLISSCDIESSTPEGRMFVALQGIFAEYEQGITGS